jgi:hypothetical protein
MSENNEQGNQVNQTRGKPPAIMCWECRLEPSRVIVARRFYCAACGDRRRRLALFVRGVRAND